MVRSPVIVEALMVLRLLHSPQIVVAVAEQRQRAGAGDVDRGRRGGAIRLQIDVVGDAARSDVPGHNAGRPAIGTVNDVERLVDTTDIVLRVGVAAGKPTPALARFTCTGWSR